MANMRGGNICCVLNCKNSSMKAKQKGEKLMFFTFPKDANLRKEWVKKCYHKNKNMFSNDLNKRICSKHFRRDDYEDELQARLLNLHPRKLKKTAVPSLFLCPNENNNNETTHIFINRVSSVKIKQEEIESWRTEGINHEVDSKIIEPHFGVKNSIKQEMLEEDKRLIKPPILDSIKTEPLSTVSESRQIDVLQLENAVLKQQIDTFKKNEILYQERIDSLQSQIENDQNSFENKVKDMFKDFLTSSQIELILKKKTTVHWSAEELSHALRLFPGNVKVSLAKF